MKQKNIILLAVLALIVLVGSGTINLQQFVGPGAVTPTTGAVTTAGGAIVTQGSDCAYQPTLRFTAKDAVSGANITDINAIVYLNDALVADQRLSADNDVTVNKGQSYRVIYFDGDGTVSWLGKDLGNVTAGCGITDVTGNVYKAGSIATLAIYKDDDVTANSSSAQQAIGAGETVQARIKIKEGTSLAGFGNPDVIVCMDYNAVAFSDITVSGSNFTSVAIGTPYGHTVTDSGNSGRNGSKCFQITPSNQLKDYSYIEPYFNIKASTSVNPTGVPPNTDANIGITVYDSYWFLNTNSGSWANYVRSPVDGGNIGLTNATGTYYYT